MATKPSKGIMSEEHKQKIRIANKGKHHSPNSQFKKGHKGFISNLGKHLSEETRKKISESRRGISSWAKGKTFSAEYRKKLSDAHKGIQAGEKHPLWKDNKAGVVAIHSWVKFRKQKPECCNDCGIKKPPSKLHWSNIDHKYRRNLDDYTARCPLCHRKYDVKNNIRKH